MALDSSLYHAMQSISSKPATLLCTSNSTARSNMPSALCACYKKAHRTPSTHRMRAHKTLEIDMYPTHGPEVPRYPRNCPTWAPNCSGSVHRVSPVVEKPFVHQTVVNSARVDHRGTPMY